MVIAINDDDVLGNSQPEGGIVIWLERQIQ